MSCLFNKNLHYLLSRTKEDASGFFIKSGLALNVWNDIYFNDHIPDVNTAQALADYFQYPVDMMIKLDIEKKEQIANDFDFKFLVLDIDGVMTEGSIIYTDLGDELKVFSAKDGLAIIRLVEAGNNVGFLSSGFRKNIIEHRAQVLGVKFVYIGTWKKLEILQQWCSELNIGLHQVAYIGDDLNDIAIIEKVGLSACPSDATDIVKQKSHIVLSAKGGKACVREFVDTYLMKFTKNPF
jgi:YrbI family 3-deoxy-D-manno-octulosonate 8-phosphate phosphatase